MMCLVAGRVTNDSLLAMAATLLHIKKMCETTHAQ